MKNINLNISDNKQLHIDLIFAVSGARSEFIDGWLSSLSNYNSKKWIIDNQTGKSLIQPTLMAFHHNKEYNLVSECKNIFVNYDSKKRFSSAYHPYYLNHNITENDLKNNHFRFIFITQKEESKPKIFWENLIKNFFPYSKNITKEHLNMSKIMFSNMKKIYNNGLYIEEMKKKWDKIDDYKNVTLIEIEYEEIIKPSGSYYLQKKLNLNVTEKDHKYWEKQLKKSHSQLEVECFGKIYRYEDLKC